MERSRRQPAQSGAAAAKAKALEQLRAAREGSGKRALAYAVKEEDAVYDVVDDHQYAEIVKKRRDAGDFIVDDDGAGYADIGEDDYWNERPDGDEGDEDEDEDGADGKHANKKRKKDHGKAGSKRGGKADGEEGPSKPEGGNITSLFRKAAAKGVAIPGLQRGSAAAAGSKATDASSDDVLDSILGDILPDAPLPAAAAAVRGPAAAGGAFGRPVAALRPPHMPMATAALPRPSGAAAVAARPLLYSGGAMGHHAAAAAGVGAAGGVVVKREEQYQQQEQQQQHHAYQEEAVGADGGDGDDDVMTEAGAGGDAMQVEEDAAAAAAPSIKQEEDVKTHAPSAAATAPAAAPVPAVNNRNFVETPATPLDGAALQRVEDVWEDLKYAEGAGNDDGAPGAAPSPLPDGLTPGAAAVQGNGALSAHGASAAAPLPLDAAGVLPFYLLDAYENPDARPGEVLLFGKVEAEAGRWQSCAACVRGLQRSLLVVPRPEVFADPDGAIAGLEAAVKEQPGRRVELLKMLQERCSAVREEVRSLLSRAGVSSLRMVPVKRSYAFEHPEVPHGEQWVIKVRYPAHLPTLPSSSSGGPPSGKTFVAIFGTQQSCLEALMLKRRIKGPGWLGLQQPQRVEYANQSTWCKVEVSLDGPKRLLSAEKGLPVDTASRPAPPLVVASLSLKTNIHPSTHQHEVVAASVVHLCGVSPDAPLSSRDWSSPQRLRNFSIVRRLDGQAWPHGMESAAASENATPRGRANGGNMVSLVASERSLLTCLLARLQALDADVLVGHNISAFDLTTLLTRMQHHKVPLWSRIGRVKKTEFPRLTGGGHTFGGGAGAGVLSTVAGRLLCDTYLSARELVKSVDFTLATLA
ncbi:hypothetical protein Agub_g2584, partial [Astrephomene gubernaculifera]